MKQYQTLEEEAYYRNFVETALKDIPGGDPEHPMPITDDEVKDLLHTVDTLKDGATLPPPPSWLVVGTRVRVEDRDCVFNGSDGKIIEVDPEHAKLKLMISIFERDTPVELEFGQVGPCED